MKVFAQRPTRISAVATVLLKTNTFTVRYYERQTDRDRDRHRERQRVKASDKTIIKPDFFLLSKFLWFVS